MLTFGRNRGFLDNEDFRTELGQMGQNHSCKHLVSNGLPIVGCVQVLQVQPGLDQVKSQLVER